MHACMHGRRDRERGEREGGYGMRNTDEQEREGEKLQSEGAKSTGCWIPATGTQKPICGPNSAPGREKREVDA